MNPPVTEPDGPSPALRGYSLRQIAIVAFFVGVLIHACVLAAVFSGDESAGNGTTSENIPSIAPVASPESSPTPALLPDRTSCAQIQGTNYRSETERAWFLQNCTGSSLPLMNDRGYG